MILAPLQPLTDGAAALGHNFLALDGDGPARRMPPFVRNGYALPAVARDRGCASGRRLPSRRSRPRGEAIRVPRSPHSARAAAGEERRAIRRRHTTS